MKKKGIWIPIELMNDAKLDWPNKVLLAEIYSLSKLKNGCIASNQFFGDLLGIDKSAASKRITKLANWGYISCNNIKKDGQCIGRVITKGSSKKNNTVVPGEQGGSSRKPKRVVPKDPDPSSDGKPINTSTNSVLLNQLEVHTGESDQDASKLKNNPVSMNEKFKVQWDDAAGFLYDATTIGNEIFEYIDSNEINKLKSIIGKSEFERIEPQINSYIQSSQMLGY